MPNGVATWCYFDEFHILLRDPLTASYFVAVWKMLRKQGCVPSALTQNVKDLLASREIENILDNTDFMMLLSQAQSDRAILAKQLGISEHQLSYITHSNSGEGLLFYGNVTIPFVDRFPRGEIYDLLTTSPEDLAHEQTGRISRPRAGLLLVTVSRSSIPKANRTKQPQVQAPHGEPGEQLDAAREKLAKQKPPKKPGPIKRIARSPDTTPTAFLHGKLYQVERENVGVEGAHRSERSGEAALHYGRHKLRKAIREHPAKAVERAETSTSRPRRTTTPASSPGTPGNAGGRRSARYLQPHKLKREYRARRGRPPDRPPRPPNKRDPPRAVWRKRRPTSSGIPWGRCLRWRRVCWWC